MTMIHLKVGETYPIVFEENISTGYQWNYEPNQLAYVSIDKTYLPTERNIIGQTHKIQFEITALKKGFEEITFKYCRDWEKDIAPIESTKISIKIK